MKLNIAVVDDLASDREYLLTMLNKYFASDEWRISITEFDSAENFLQNYRKGTFHIIFLDIYMKEINGIELSKRLRLGDLGIEIIFISSTTDQMINTFPSKPSGYLCKPYTFDKFKQAIESALRSFKKEVKSYTVKLPRAEVNVPISDILSAVADKHSTDIMLISGTSHKCIKPYTEVSNELLNESCFIECNRGVLINMDYVMMTKDMESKVTLQGGIVYPIRFRDRKDIAGRLTVYLATKLRGGLDI